MRAAASIAKVEHVCVCVHDCVWVWRCECVHMQCIYVCIYVCYMRPCVCNINFHHYTQLQWA